MSLMCKMNNSCTAKPSMCVHEMMLALPPTGSLFERNSTKQTTLTGAQHPPDCGGCFFVG